MAATTISTTINATTSNTLTAQTGINGPPAGHKINASEVGWLFVHEYYTFLNKDPSRLYCFYGQKSSLIHGTEGETVTLSQGEKEIKEKFQGLNLEDCRVLVTNVDSLASNNGGIVIQVLGEMSNRNEVARRFAQTFFLDVQPNGYYVLNDIIRFQSDEDIEIYNGEEVAGTSISPAGTLVDEPIDVSSPRVEQASPSDSTQNTTITEPSLVTPRDTGLDIPVTFSTNPVIVPLRAASIDMEVTVPVVDDGRMHTQPQLTSSITPDTSGQPPKSGTIAQPVQSSPPSPLVVQNNNGQKPAIVTEKDPVTTLAGIVSQEVHATPLMQSIQTYPSRPQSASVVSSNTQSPANLNKQEPVTAPANIESHLLKKASLQGNNVQTPNSTAVDAATTSNVLPVEQDKNGPQPAISKKPSEQSPTTNALQGVGQAPSTQIVSTTSSGTHVTQNRTELPANIPKQASAQSPVFSIDAQSQTDSHSPQSATDNKVQVSSNGPKSPKSPSTLQKVPTTGPQQNDQETKRISRPESPSGLTACPVSSSAVNNKGQPANAKQPINKNISAHAVKKSSAQNVPKNVVTTGSSDSEQQGVKSSNHTPQMQAPVKKTWASLAANGLEKWNNTALSEAKGVVASVPVKSGTQAQSQHMRDNRDRRSEGLKNNNRRNSDTSLSIYVKGVTSSMTYDLLKSAFTSFGHVKHLDVVHSKSCAFVDFSNFESYRRALDAHTVEIGGETVNTEERRARRNTGKASRGRF
ncbi:12931_t:CDS:2 [Funneliformis caledonium]|uniref:12931_t:CDS:1 n=1 Tax=Funneliformis caledonium TaxID=1117310 RepID=A0A9N9BC22_9GLOM|nr:12931_t:CDS:2 [Funneliformis caledonium]